MKDWAPLLAVVLSAAASYWAGRRAAHLAHYRALASSAYVDLCKALANIAMAQRKNDQTAADTAKALLADAKARLCAYAEPAVVAAAAQFERGGVQLDAPVRMNNLVRLTHAVRRADGMGAVANADVSRLLFGVDLDDHGKPVPHDD